MRIVLVNQHHPPDAGATGKLAAQLARALARRGHSVTVITGRPTYDEAREARPPRHEHADGVRVLRLPLLPRRDAPVARMLHYLSFASALLLRGVFLPRPDVLLAFSSTPIFGGPACAMLARLLGCPFVYVVQDVYPEIAVALGLLRAGWQERIARALDAVAWRSASRVVVIGPELAAVARSRGVDARNVTVIPNWVNPAEIRPRAASPFRRDLGIGDDEFVVEYAGNLGRSQDLDAVMEAARIVENETSGARPIRFLLVGGGSRASELRRTAESLAGVTVVPRQDESRLSDVLAAADLSLVPLRPNLTRWCVPSKVYSILASERPIGASLDADSEIAQLVERSDVGFRVDPGDARSLAREILRLARDPDLAREQGRRGRARAEGEGSLESAASRYEDLLDSIVRSSAGT